MKLEKVLKYKKGKSPQKGQDEDNLILYLTPEYLRGNSIPNYIPEFPIKVEVNDGDLLLLWDGSNAGEFFKGKKGILSSTMVKFDFDKLEFNSEFLFYQLKAFEGYLKAQTNGSGIPHVDKEILLGLEIENLEKTEQTRIAEILITVDEAITHTEALIAKYQRIKTGLMQDLLTKGIDENGNIRSKETNKFMVKNGIEVPEEWEVDTIGNHCIRSAFGPRFSGTFYSISGNIGTLRTTDLDLEGNINYKTIPFANLNKTEFGSHLLEANDLLITRSGTVGIVSVFEKQNFDVIPGAFLIRFRLKPSIAPEFLRYYFRNEIGKRRLLDIAEGGVQKNIRGSSVLKLFVPIPKPIEQKKIMGMLDESDKLIKEHLLHLNKLQSLKTGLMQDLLSGRVRVKMDNKN